MADVSNSPSQRWLELKARGSFTKAEIDAIDADTPWAVVEPKWWLDMMEARKNVQES